MSDSLERSRAARPRFLSYALSIVGSLVCAACADVPPDEEALSGRALVTDPALEGEDFATGAQGAAPDSDLGNPDSDFDKDGLLNKVETNTGKFVNAADTGTNPRDPDTDRDGISDGEEVLGTASGLNLPAMGVSPVHRNLLVEYDWFDDSFECAPTGVVHSHRPTAATIAVVSAGFARAPVDNPDGTRGIAVIHDYGQSPVFTGGTKIANPVEKINGGATSPDFQALKKKNFAANRAGYFHYVLMAHRYIGRDPDGKVNENSGGNAEMPGNALMVTFYCVNNPTGLGHVTMHELGHNLGLRHGGDEELNNKPNYNSVMNYLYQNSGVDTDCKRGGDGLLDFSHNKLAPLQETKLYEPKGICNDVPWDWNGNGSIETAPVMFDVNNDKKYTELHDYDDWAFVLGKKTLARFVVDPEESPLCPPPASEAAVSPGGQPTTVSPDSTSPPSNTAQSVPPGSTSPPSSTAQSVPPGSTSPPSSTDETASLDGDQTTSATDETETPDEDTTTADTDETETPDEDTTTADTDETETPDEDTTTADTDETEMPDEDMTTADTDETETPDEDTTTADTDETETPDENMTTADTDETETPDENMTTADTDETETPDEDMTTADTDETAPPAEEEEQKAFIRTRARARTRN